MLSRLLLALLVVSANAGKVDDLIHACKLNRQFKRQCPYILCLFTTKSPKKCMPV
jgi:hypothetical protein